VPRSRFVRRRPAMPVDHAQLVPSSRSQELGGLRRPAAGAPLRIQNGLVVSMYLKWDDMALSE